MPVLERFYRILVAIISLASLPACVMAPGILLGAAEGSKNDEIVGYRSRPFAINQNDWRNESGWLTQGWIARDEVSLLVYARNSETERPRDEFIVETRILPKEETISALPGRVTLILANGQRVIPTAYAFRQAPAGCHIALYYPLKALPERILIPSNSAPIPIKKQSGCAAYLWHVFPIAPPSPEEEFAVLVGGIVHGERLIPEAHIGFSKTYGR